MISLKAEHVRDTDIYNTCTVNVRPLINCFPFECFPLISFIQPEYSLHCNSNSSFYVHKSWANKSCLVRALVGFLAIAFFM